MKLIIASNIKGFAEAIGRKGYDIVTDVKNTDDLQRYFGSTEVEATCLLITEKIDSSGSLVSIILDIHKKFPEIRIIYFATGDLTNKFTVNQLNTLATHGIHDLCYEGKIDINKIKALIDNPKSEIDSIKIYNAYKSMNLGTVQTAQPVMQPSITKRSIQETTSKQNVFAVTSVKPGTGKSFVSSNVAVTLAKYGKKQDGSKPKILLLEGDLQTLSVTTLFGLKDDDFNLKTALRKIDSFFARNNGNVNAWQTRADEEKQFINRCCLRTSIDNLYVLEGHNFDFNDISETDSASYYYLVDYLSTQFDEIIIDSNSSLQHPTTDPILQLSKILYFVYTTDFNNIKLNVRYKDELAKLGVANKIKYVLNKVLVGEQKLNYKFEYSDEDIVKGNGNLRIDFKLPNVDMALLLNSTYKHKQLAMDNTEKTLRIRVSFLRIANDIMPTGNVEDLEEQLAMMKKKYSKIKK